MAVSYTQSLSADMVITEIESLLDWRGHVFRQCFYPASQVKPADAYAPAALLMWCRKGQESGAMDRAVVDRLQLAYDELGRAAQKMLDASVGGQPPAVEAYAAFEVQFEGYITQIRRLYQDMSDAGMSVDTVTGLRTVSGLRAELKREQDRYDRKGTAYSIANIEIDNLAALQQSHDRRGMDAVYAAVAGVIARTVRSFDDAYYLGKGEYLLILKHIDFMDACAVMDRLRAEIAATPVQLPDGSGVRVTCSLGVAEAMQRETPEAALDHAKAALQAALGGGGNRVQEFRETSVLEQYARDVHK